MPCATATAGLRAPSTPPLSRALRALIASLALFFPSLLGATPPVGGKDSTPPGKTAELIEARRLAREGRAPQALAVLAAAFSRDDTLAMDVLSDPAFARLLEDPVAREQLRALLERHARRSYARMTRPAEPGSPLLVEVTIVDGGTGRPLSGARVGLVQADARGIYAPPEDGWNPRLFAFLVSDPEGKVGVETIRPGSYGDGRGGRVPAHIHFNIAAPGYRPYNGEFVFDDGPTAENTESRTPPGLSTGSAATAMRPGAGAGSVAARTPFERAAGSAPRAAPRSPAAESATPVSPFGDVPVARVSTKEDGRQRAEVVIPLQPQEGRR